MLLLLLLFLLLLLLPQAATCHSSDCVCCHLFPCLTTAVCVDTELDDSPIQLTTDTICVSVCACAALLEAILMLLLLPQAATCLLSQPCQEPPWASYPCRHSRQEARSTVRGGGCFYWGGGEGGEKMGPVKTPQ
jgi:hypothetical protein